LGGDSNRGRKPKNKERRVKGEERSPLRVPISSISKEKLFALPHGEKENYQENGVMNSEETETKKENWKHPKQYKEGAEERNPQQVPIS